VFLPRRRIGRNTHTEHRLSFLGPTGRHFRGLLSAVLFPCAWGIIRLRTNPHTQPVILSAANDLARAGETPLLRGPDPSASPQDDRVLPAHEFSESASGLAMAGVEGGPLAKQPRRKEKPHRAAQTRSTPEESRDGRSCRAELSSPAGPRHLSGLSASPRYPARLWG